MHQRLLAASVLLAFSACVFAQVDEGQTGGWYSYFFNNNFESSPWGVQFNAQHRNWEPAGDMQQILILGALTWKPESSDIRYSLGYYNLQHGTYGPDDTRRSEHIAFQQALKPARWGESNYVTHRLRLEEHWPEGGDAFGRLRYFLSLNRPLNQTQFNAGAWYLSLYNELFINLEGSAFALNRLYGGLGYKFTDHTSWQLGYMHQNTRNMDKGQLVVNLFHHF